VKKILIYINNTVNYDLFYPKSSTFELTSYSDADFTGCKSDRKSSGGTCHFLGHSLVSSLFITEAEYIVASVACGQILWIKQTLIDYGITSTISPIMCDNINAINLSKKPIQHSRTNISILDIIFYVIMLLRVIFL